MNRPGERPLTPGHCVLLSRFYASRVSCKSEIECPRSSVSSRPFSSLRRLRVRIADGSCALRYRAAAVGPDSASPLGSWTDHKSGSCSRGFRDAGFADLTRSRVRSKRGNPEQVAASLRRPCAALAQTLRR